MSSAGPEFNPAMQADEPLTPFDVTRTSERAGLFKLALGFGLLALVAFIVMKLYQPGTRDRSDPPVITAENTPFKIIPEDREGMQTPDQDKEVFDVMSGADTRSDIITLPPPETPIERPEGEPSETRSQASEAPTVSEPDNTTPDTVFDRPVMRDPVPAPAPVEEPVIATTPDLVPDRSPPAATVSDWVVQVASLRSETEARSTYAAILSKNSRLLSPYSSDIVRADLAEKGVYYRARVSGFSSKADANTICTQLKAAGQSCFVTRR